MSAVHTQTNNKRQIKQQDSVKSTTILAPSEQYFMNTWHLTHFVLIKVSDVDKVLLRMC